MREEDAMLVDQSPCTQEALPKPSFVNMFLPYRVRQAEM